MATTGTLPDSHRTERALHWLKERLHHGPDQAPSLSRPPNFLVGWAGRRPLQRKRSGTGTPCASRVEPRDAHTSRP